MFNLVVDLSNLVVAHENEGYKLKRFCIEKLDKEGRGSGSYILAVDYQRLDIPQDILKSWVSLVEASEVHIQSITRNSHHDKYESNVQIEFWYDSIV